MLATTFGAMFAPDKKKVVSRCVLSAILFVPALALIPLSFAACSLLVTIAFILGITIWGIRASIELLIDGIPEMDDEGNIIEPKSTETNTAPWV
tara:strand:- start:281 stop:562 length:282 start_codon:yes stop_codon:yes gene_type:complete